jgi:hypothetical protein
MRFRFHLPAAALIVAVVGLGACTAHDGAGPLAGGSGGGAAKTTYTMADFAPTTYCPPLQLRPGTEALTTYEHGHDNEVAYVRQQASITQTARECHLVGNTLSVKVGVAGRVVAGPKGGAGTVTLPIRVAVTKQVGATGPIYTHLFKVPVAVTAPDFSASYDEVFDQVSFNVAPDDRNLIIYVGFDEGK